MKAHETGTPPETGAKSCKKPGALSPETEECLRRTTEIIHRAAMLGPGELRHAIENMPGFEDIKQHPGPITPELIDLLYGKLDRKKEGTPMDEQVKKGDKVSFRSILPRMAGYPSRLDEWEYDPFSKENMHSPDPPYLIPSRKRTVYDVKSGMPVPQGITSPSSLDEIREAYNKLASIPSNWWLIPDSGTPPSFNYDDKFREPPPIMEKIRTMLDNDKRLADSDKEVIIFNLLNGKYPLFGPSFSQRQSNESLGDIVHQKVKEYLAKKASATKTTLQIDAEAGVRILELHFDNMFALRFEEINPDSKQVTEAEVLAAIEAIPKARLGELSLSWVTIKSLMGSIADYTIYASVRKAIEEKLKN